MSKVLEVLTLHPKDIHAPKTEINSIASYDSAPEPGSDWEKERQRCERRRDWGEEKEKEGGGWGGMRGLSLRIYLSKPPTLRF